MSFIFTWSLLPTKLYWLLYFDWPTSYIVISLYMCACVRMCVRACVRACVCMFWAYRLRKYMITTRAVCCFCNHTLPVSWHMDQGVWLFLRSSVVTIRKHYWNHSNGSFHSEQGRQMPLMSRLFHGCSIVRQMKL